MRSLWETIQRAEVRLLPDSYSFWFSFGLTKKYIKLKLLAKGQNSYDQCWLILFLFMLVMLHNTSPLITFKSRVFPDKNANLQFSGLVGSGLVGLIAKSSVFKTRQFWNLLSSHLRFWVSFNLLSSQRLIFRLPKNPVTPQTLLGVPCITINSQVMFQMPNIAHPYLKCCGCM